MQQAKETRGPPQSPLLENIYFASLESWVILNDPKFPPILKRVFFISLGSWVIQNPSIENLTASKGKQSLLCILRQPIV